MTCQQLPPKSSGEVLSTDTRSAHPFFGPELVAALERVVDERLDARLAEPSSRFLSRTALAARYGVGDRTVRTWRERGLPGIRVGREVMYDVDECDRWIERQG